jgi:hypothetical protein
MSNKTPQAAQYDPLLHRQSHIAMLTERVFQIARWPHYQLLLDDLMELAERGHSDDPALPYIKWKVLSLERTLLYGGKSMFAPIFYGHDYRIREASPESAYERGPYNAHMIDSRFMEYGKPSSGHAHCSNAFDLLLIPNALHHIPVADEWGTHFDFLAGPHKSILRPGGYLYIYEQFIEEIHQKPDDYVRYTPHGLATLLEAAGYQIEYVRQTGDIYTSTTFLLDQILEYIEGGQPREGVSHLDHGMAKAEDIRRIQGMIKSLQKMAPNYPHNGLRSHTECPKAFSVLARKPV